MNEKIKDYLTSENQRNKEHAGLYKRLLDKAFGGSGRTEQEMVGHHISFEFDGDIETMNEIPSADTLLFDHTIMRKVFGPDAPMILRRLAMVPSERREAALELMIRELGVNI